MKIEFILISILLLLLAACSPTATPAPTLPPTRPAPTQEAYFTSDGGGEPRSANYWLIWNSCTEGNKSETAIANGGRQAGWILLDDLLADPGILLGEVQVETCSEAVGLLQGTSIDSDDAAGLLAAQLLVAQLNLAAGAEYCPAVDDAMRSAQLLLIGAGFDGVYPALGENAAQEQRELAVFLTDQLASYNVGELCR